MSNEQVRYCYSCGHIGEVDANCVSCCPDAPGTVGYVSERFAHSMNREIKTLSERCGTLMAELDRLRAFVRSVNEAAIVGVVLRDDGEEDVSVTWMDGVMQTGTELIARPARMEV